MTYEEVRDALAGLYAHETEAPTHTPNHELKKRTLNTIRQLDPDDKKSTIAKAVIDLTLSPTALADGYGPKDAHQFLQWCDRQGILT